MKRLAWMLLGLALIVAVLAVGRLTPTPNDRVAQIAKHGKLGETVETGGFTVTVHKAQATTTLTAQSSFGDKSAQRTDQIWLVLDTTIVGDWRPTTYDDARLETDGGFLYRSSDRITSGIITEDTIQPGIGRRGMIVFELPKNRLAGATLRLGRSKTEDVRLGPEAVIDLEIDAAKADELAKNPVKQIRLPDVRYG